MSDNNEKKIPDWLKNLQENSWELELLVSGGAIFSLLQLSDLYIEWIDTLRITSHLPGIGIVMVVGMLGIKILTIGFILHLILRAFWLGLVCVNYVFPGGINGSKLKHQKPFNPKHFEGDMKVQIMRIDNLCGTLMFTSIISAVAVSGLITLFCAMLFLILNLESNFDSAFFEWFGVILLTQLWLYVIDLLFMGVLRKIPFLTYLLYPFFKVFDFLSFRFFYQRALNLFSTNVKKLRFFGGAVIFATGSFITTYLSIYRSMHWPNLFDKREYRWQMAPHQEIVYGMYRDQLNDGERRSVTIQSKIVEENYLDVFVLYDRNSDELIKKSNELDSLQFFSNIIGVSIDDSIYNDVEWHQTWNRDITNIGISAMIDIRHLSNNQHELKIFTKVNWKNEQEKFDREIEDLIIPFWKDVN